MYTICKERYVDYKYLLYLFSYKKSGKIDRERGKAIWKSANMIIHKFVQ